MLIVHSGYYREVNGEHWVQHDVEAYVKVDLKGWKAVARTIRPLRSRNCSKTEVREAGWFVFPMGRLVEMYPNWACHKGHDEAVADPRGNPRTVSAT